MDVVFFSSKGKDEGNGRDLNKQYDRDQKGCGCNNTAIQDFISTKALVFDSRALSVKEIQYLSRSLLDYF